jgi:hypothetical protein
MIQRMNIGLVSQDFRTRCFIKHEIMPVIVHPSVSPPYIEPGDGDSLWYVFTIVPSLKSNSVILFYVSPNSQQSFGFILLASHFLCSHLKTLEI